VSKTKAPTPLEQLLERHKIACDLKQTVDREKIAECLQRWAGRIIKEPMKIAFSANFAAYQKDARAARAARAAWDARAARAARAAWDARAARAARAAWAARAARAARDARAAWDAWAAWDARDARDAWDARAAWDAWAAWDARDARDASWECSWISITSIGALARSDEKTMQDWLPILEAFEAGAFCFCIKDDWIHVATLPTRVLVGGERRLHCEDGPAFEWLGDFVEYYWHGVRVPEAVILRPTDITVEVIEAEDNAEVRRVMVERFGQERYVRESGAEEVHRDDFGILRCKIQKGDDPILMVQVANSTAEKDGSSKEYFLPVHHELRPLPPGDWPTEKKRAWLDKQKPQELTARNAVASTWGRRGEDYDPAIET